VLKKTDLLVARVSLHSFHRLSSSAGQGRFWGLGVPLATRNDGAGKRAVLFCTGFSELAGFDANLRRRVKEAADRLDMADVLPGHTRQLA
jgi:hypothetical protein